MKKVKLIEYINNTNVKFVPKLDSKLIIFYNSTT